jgi:quercetin dioxygenase-like cupin family protein
MAVPHAQPGEVVDVRPLDAALGDQITRTLVKTDQMELIRLVLAPNKEIATHRAAGPIVVQCLEGHVAFTTMGKTLQLTPGCLIHLRANEPHSLKAEQAASLLLTILLPKT